MGRIICRYLRNKRLPNSARVLQATTCWLDCFLQGALANPLLRDSDEMAEFLTPSAKKMVRWQCPRRNFTMIHQGTVSNSTKTIILFKKKKKKKKRKNYTTGSRKSTLVSVSHAMKRIHVMGGGVDGGGLEDDVDGEIKAAAAAAEGEEEEDKKEKEKTKKHS